MAVYFIQAPSGIKIGYSRSVERRLAQLQTAHGSKLKLMAVVPDGTRQLESDLHRVCAKWRMAGEWFRPVPKLLNLIASIRRNDKDTALTRIQTILEEPTPQAKVKGLATAVIPANFRGTEKEALLLRLDALIRDNAAPQVLRGKGHATIRKLLRGGEVDTSFLCDYPMA